MAGHQLSSLRDSCHPTKPSSPQSFVRVKPKYKLDDRDDQTCDDRITHDDHGGKHTPEAESQQCPVCWRKFVYQLNFVKHLASASCHPPPTKKSRKDIESVNGAPDDPSSDSYKSNTLPRAKKSSRKPNRTGSVRNKKRQQQQNKAIESFTSTESNHPPGTRHVDDGREHETGTGDDNVSPSSRRVADSDITCHFCQMHLSSETHFRRHRLAHGLVMQLTRSLRLSSSPGKDWLAEQVRLSVLDKNWLRQAVREVEQCVERSDIDRVVRQRHGISDDADFDNVVDLLMTGAVGPAATLKPSHSSTPEIAAGVSARDPNTVRGSRTCWCFAIQFDRYLLGSPFLAVVGSFHFSLFILSGEPSRFGRQSSPGSGSIGLHPSARSGTRRPGHGGS